MKKFSLILPGAIALLMVATPFAVQARPSGLLAQQTQQQPKRVRANKLNLTDTQKQQAKAIQEQTRNEIVSQVLTQAQRNQYNAAVQQGQKGSWRSLNLTDAQKTEIRNRMQASRQRVEREVLTQAQRDQMQQFRNQQGQRRSRPGA
ncbi:MAG: hypothetical protein KME10_13375 [Plectolyngbya sp. WJT66-NPBG17]|jgi:Spy/CpxP family protein refolding chaperone|nr:hypothetical protein [Plectolyngbya sp. WJT66-NPBG17]MBW4525885.1 hypothetical protein [Phormidium tanganyikae FI6-MK23]